MRRKSLVIIALIAITLALAYRFRGVHFDWALFFQSFRHMQMRWLLASVVATFATYLIRAVRWQVLLDPLKQIHLHALMIATLVGFSAIYILGRAGELVRPVWLTRRERVALSASVATILVERFLDSLMLVILFAATLLIVELPPSAHAGGAMDTMTRVAWVLVFSSVGLLVSMFFLRTNIDRIVSWIPFRRVGSLLHSFAEGLAFLQKGRSFTLAVVHSVLLWIAIALQFWFMMLGMNFEFSLAAATLVMVGAAIGSIAQIPGIGGGFQAGFVFCLSTFFAVSAEKSVAASLVAWVFSYVPTVGIAAVYMLLSGLSFRDLRVQAVSE